MSRLVPLAAFLLCLSCLPVAARGGERSAFRTSLAASFGSVADAGYGAKGTASFGWEFEEHFGLELAGGIGVTEEIELGPERFYHFDLLVPARLSLCKSDSWVCPGSTFEFVVLSGVGAARFTGRWAPTVIGGVALDSFRTFEPVDIGIRVGFVGHYDVLHYEHLVAMLQLNLAAIFRF